MNPKAAQYVFAKKSMVYVKKLTKAYTKIKKIASCFPIVFTMHGVSLNQWLVNNPLINRKVKMERRIGVNELKAE